MRKDRRADSGALLIGNHFQTLGPENKCHQRPFLPDLGKRHKLVCMFVILTNYSQRCRECGPVN